MRLSLLPMIFTVATGTVYLSGCPLNGRPVENPVCTEHALVLNKVSNLWVSHNNTVLNIIPESHALNSVKIISKADHGLPNPDPLFMTFTSPKGCVNKYPAVSTFGFEKTAHGEYTAYPDNLNHAGLCSDSGHFGAWILDVTYINSDFDGSVAPSGFTKKYDVCFTYD